MGLSRRQFTKEFKLAAVRRLEQGVSIGEAARALEVNPNVLHRWRREFRQGPGNVFPGNGKQRWSEGRIAELERKGLQSEKETAVVHDRNFAVETNRRTMNFQRAAECVLTGCLSPGGRFRF